MAHVLKHSSKDCVGLLIANGDKLVDTIPLFHESVVGPSLDAAFHMLQDFYLSPNPSYKIAGVYEASVNSKNNKFLPSTYRILDVLKENANDKLIALKININEAEEATQDEDLELTYYIYEGENRVDKTDHIKCNYSVEDIQDLFT